MSTAVATTALQPFQFDASKPDLDDLRSRVNATRWPPRETVKDASQGVQLGLLQELARYWGSEYDMGRLASRLNAVPQFSTEIDGLRIHFIHVKSRHPNALPLIISHGWPGSVLEMLDVIGPLTDPTAHGGKAEDAFDVVLPSLPGYGLSSQPTESGWSGDRTARAWAELMSRLGYTRYVAQGGDQGAGVTDSMARQAPKGLLGIHLNLLGTFPTEVLAAVFGGEIATGVLKRVAFAVVASRADREQKALEAVEALFMRGYLAEMNTRPQTIGYGMGDPMGLVAWALDHDADSYQKISRAFLDGRPTGGLTRDAVLDNQTLYWLTNTGTTAARLYWENAQLINAALASGQKAPELKLPVGFTVFPGEIMQTPRSWAEKVYPNLTYFNEAPKGGHFAAWEEPEIFSQELRAAFRPLRS